MKKRATATFLLFRAFVRCSVYNVQESICFRYSCNYFTLQFCEAGAKIDQALAELGLTKFLSGPELVLNGSNSNPFEPETSINLCERLYGAVTKSRISNCARNSLYTYQAIRNQDSHFKMKIEYILDSPKWFHTVNIEMNLAAALCIRHYLSAFKTVATRTRF